MLSDPRRGTALLVTHVLLVRGVNEENKDDLKHGGVTYLTLSPPTSGTSPGRFLKDW